VDGRGAAALRGAEILGANDSREGGVCGVGVGAATITSTGLRKVREQKIAAVCDVDEGVSSKRVGTEIESWAPPKAEKVPNLVRRAQAAEDKRLYMPSRLPRRIMAR